MVSCSRISPFDNIFFLVPERCAHESYRLKYTVYSLNKRSEVDILHPSCHGPFTSILSTAHVTSSQSSPDMIRTTDLTMRLQEPSCSRSIDQSVVVLLDNFLSIYISQYKLYIRPDIKKSNYPWVSTITVLWVILWSVVNSLPQVGWNIHTTCWPFYIWDTKSRLGILEWLMRNQYYYYLPLSLHTILVQWQSFYFTS